MGRSSSYSDPVRRCYLSNSCGPSRWVVDSSRQRRTRLPSVSRHLGVLKSAGLVQERRDANRIYYSLVEERLALCVGGFLSAVCPDQIVLRRRRRGAAAETS